MASLRHPLLLLISDVENKALLSFASWAKWFLKSLLWILFVSWISVFFLAPSDFGAQLYDHWVASTTATLFGETGCALLLYSGPIFAIAFLAVPYLALSRIEQHQFHGNKTPMFHFRTFPVLVDGPLGIVSAAEFFWILVFFVFILWAAYSYTITNLEILPDFGHLTPLETSGRVYLYWPTSRVQLLQMSAYCFGLIALSCLAFLFIPIARGSILLCLTNIPFEHAARYHMWLGHLTMFVLTLHGLGYMIVWTIRGILASSIVEWRSDSGANLAGVISYTFSLLIWVTSLRPLRKLYFELFFYTHQLYILFVIFFALHVGDTTFSKTAGGLFLFMLDRFLRFCQSRRAVSIISGTIFPCGTVKLVLLKPRNLQYNALSFIFLRVQEISWLQWHPFSVSSSPLDGDCHISVLVKATGSWTSRLKGMVLNAHVAESYVEIPFPHYSKITAFVEGPYGHQFPYHVRYRNLILVAGGSGISPFFAIVSDICHLIKEGKPCFPRNILIVWAVKRSYELSVLSKFEGIFPLFSDEVNVEIQAFVTRESEPQVGRDEVENIMNCSVLSSSSRCSMSVLVGTGSEIWSGIYIFLSSVGFAICLGLLEAYYIKPLNISSWWHKGLLFLACMVASVLVFGGLVVGMWHNWGKTWGKEDSEEDREKMDGIQHDELVAANANFCSIRYGCRPDFKEIIEIKKSEWWEDESDIGVIVCGPPTLQSDVARECRAQNLGRRRGNWGMLHFHSHSFSF